MSAFDRILVAFARTLGAIFGVLLVVVPLVWLWP